MRGFVLAGWSLAMLATSGGAWALEFGSVAEPAVLYDAPSQKAKPLFVIARQTPVEIVVSLKDGEDRMRSVLVFTVPGSEDNCLLWPTGRRDDFRDGLVP